ncbi:MAG: STM3941 family protein [Pseudomonadota bacterium]
MSRPLTLIHADRRKMNRVLALGVGFVAVSLFLLVTGIDSGAPLLIGIGAIGAVFFGWCTWIGVTMWLGRKPLIAMDAKGVAVFRHPHLPWENFERVDVTGFLDEGFVRIVVRDPDAFLAGMPVVSRLLARANTALADGHIFVSNRLLPAPADDIAAQIAQAAQDYRSK